MTEEEYRQLLEELGFDIARNPQPNSGRALRHTTLQFGQVPGRNPNYEDAFWPTLYWNRSSAGLLYFATSPRDTEHFSPLLWVQIPNDVVKRKDANISFTPMRNTRQGAIDAFQSLFEAQIDA